MKAEGRAESGQPLASRPCASLHWTVRLCQPVSHVREQLIHEPVTHCGPGGVVDAGRGAGAGTGGTVGTDAAAPAPGDAPADVTSPLDNGDDGNDEDEDEPEPEARDDQRRRRP